MFPAYGQVYLRNYNFLGPFHELYNIQLITRLSIVTAAVYRGFDQELRLAADPIN